MNMKNSSSKHQQDLNDDQEIKNNGICCFNTSLRELRALSSQLLNAADQCETAFLKSKQKKKVMEHTKSYLCQAVVAVIDHLGTVSVNLEQTLHGSIEVSETEQRIASLNQRLLTCQQFAVSLNLSTFGRVVDFPRHYQQYQLQCVRNHNIPFNQDRLAASDGCLNDTDTNAEKKLVKTGTQILTIPVIQYPPRLSKPFNPLYGTQEMEALKMGLCDHKKQNVPKSPIFSVLLRRSKQRK
ncbi:hypothetical protein J5N97_004404 [Dioscorea zingiberensis]|uniref:Protein ABIL5 n=1 Tax=Dioscorea zingiberensis TaxID=325984 RepID=A0A9D5D8A9_9LILI|nr:hypothetical protein J5N97_004404 [Dioscorea zingiberensis]